MNITVLGSGGFGYPLTFCDCENCHKARVLGGKNIRKRASLLINNEMLIDLTPDCQTAMNFSQKSLADVKYLLQTHTHLDHFDLNLFLTLDSKYAIAMKNKLNIICSRICLEDMQFKLSQYEKMNLFDKEYLAKANLQTLVVNHGEKCRVGDYEIKAVHCTHHEALGAQLYLIKQNGKTLFYATDTPPFSEHTFAELAGEKIDCMFLDLSFGFNEFCYGHLNLKAFLEQIEQLKKRGMLADNCQIFATHITHDGNPVHDELDEILKQYGYNAAFDGQEINI